MYDKEKLLEILLHEDFYTLDDGGKPLPPSASVYTSISEKMKEFGSSISPKHVYTIVNQNRNGFKDKILKAFKIQNNEQKQDNSDYSTTSSVNHENSKEAETKDFHIILSPEQWAIIKPVRKLYGRRYRYTMQSGWTNIIAEKLWTQHKLSCVISFKKHDVSCSSSARNFISIIGHCKECDALLHGTIQNEPPNNVDVKIHISIKGIRQEKHSNQNTRHLKGKREMIADALERKDAITYPREEAEGLKEFGDPNPPILPSSAIAKEQQEKSQEKSEAEWDYQNIPLMQNGSKCAAVKINNSEFIVQQTCAFDAIFHVIAVGIATIKNYEEVAKSYENATMKLAAAVLHDGNIDVKHYIERAIILVNLPLFHDAITTHTRSIKKLNANCNAAHLLSKLFNNMPSCTKTINCICGKEKVQQLTEVSVNVDILLCKGLQYVQEAIDDASSISTTCRKCKSNVAIKVEYGSHIFVDTTIFTDDNYTATKPALKHQLDNIATSIKLQANMYILTGIVNYTKPISNCLDDGHYTAYARTGIHWYFYDDLKKERQIATAETQITPHILFYVLSK